MLSTSGTYPESDSFSDDTDDSESGTGDDGEFYLAPSGFVWTAPTSRSFSSDSATYASGSWSESGFAAVSAGNTQSASGTYTESDTTEIDYDASDSVSGSTDLSFDDGRETGDERATSSDDSTSKSLGSYTQSSSFTQTLDGDQPSVFNSVSFSALSEASSSRSQSYSSSTSLNYPYDDPESYESSSSTDTDDDQSSGWTSYQQSGTYTSTQDDGLTTNDEDIGTSQSGNFGTTDGGSGSWSHAAFNGNIETSSQQISVLSGDSYQAQNTQTDSGNFGSLQSGSFSRSQVAAVDWGLFDSGSTTNAGDSGDWASSGGNVVAVYTPAGGEEETQSLTGADGSSVSGTASGPYVDQPIGHTASSHSALSLGTTTDGDDGSYTGGPGQLSLVGTYSLTEELPAHTLGPGDLLSPTPGQYAGSNLVQPIATPPAAGPANPSPVNFANEESRGATDNKALDDAMGRMNTDGAPLAEQAADQPGAGAAVEDKAKQIPGLSGPTEYQNKNLNRVEKWYSAPAPQADLVLVSKTSTLYTSGAYKALYPGAVVVDSVQSAADAINAYAAAHAGKKFSVLIADHGRPANQSIGAGLDDTAGGYIDSTPATAKERAALADAVRGKVSTLILGGCSVGGVSSDYDGGAFIQSLAEEVGAIVYAFPSTISWSSKGISIREPKSGGAPQWIIGTPK